MRVETYVLFQAGQYQSQWHVWVTQGNTEGRGATAVGLQTAAGRGRRVRGSSSWGVVAQQLSRRLKRGGGKERPQVVPTAEVGLL